MFSFGGFVTSTKEQKMALKMLSLGHVEAGSPMRASGDDGKMTWIQPYLDVPGSW